MSSSDAFQEEKRKIAKTFSEGRLFTGSDPNKALPEYKSAVLPTHQCAYNFTDTPVCLQFYRHTSVLVPKEVFTLYSCILFCAWSTETT